MLDTGSLPVLVYLSFVTWNRGSHRQGHVVTR